MMVDLLSFILSTFLNYDFEESIHRFYVQRLYLQLLAGNLIRNFRYLLVKAPSTHNYQTNYGDPNAHARTIGDWLEK